MAVSRSEARLRREGSCTSLPCADGQLPAEILQASRYHFTTLLQRSDKLQSPPASPSYVTHSAQCYTVSEAWLRYSLSTTLLG